MVLAVPQQARQDVKRWTVVVDIDECDGAVHAVARLHDRTSDRLIGEGVARLGPVERVAPAVGPEVATASAEPAQPTARGGREA